MTTKKHFFSLILSAVMCVPFITSAQVTIGSGRAPSEWSLLDLCTDYQRKALHNARMTTEQRDALMSNRPEHSDEDRHNARGLMIFNTYPVPCLEFWNGSKWISLCEGDEPPAPPIAGGPATRCGIAPAFGNSITFTAPAYDDIIAYRFFVTQGSDIQVIEQRSNVLVLSEAVPASAVTVQYLFAASFLRPSFSERMVFVKGGEFTKGAALQDPYGYGLASAILPNASSTVSDFWIARTQVTQAEFMAVMDFNPARFQCGQPAIGANVAYSSPVEQVSWYDAVAFANRLSALEGRDIFYQVTVDDVVQGADFWLDLVYTDIPTTAGVWTVALPPNPRTNNGYRLLTNAEWEFAARGGVNRFRYQVDGLDRYFSNSNSSSDNWNGTTSATACNHLRTHSVGQFSANALDLYDMSGNVWEWVWDWHGSQVGGTDHTGPLTGSSRDTRGGGFTVGVRSTNVTNRGGFPPALRTLSVGFRLAASTQ